MAIAVPVLRERSVKDAPPANTYQSDAGATPEAFGAGIGQATAGAGRALQGVGNDLTEIAVKQQDEDNTRAVLAAKTKLDDASRTFKYGTDGTGGEFAKQGEDAIGGTARFREFYDNTTKTLAGDITNPKAKLTFDKLVTSARDADLDATSRREADARVKANAESLNAAAESAKRTAVDSANDDKVAEAQLNVGLGAIRSNILGQPAAVVDAAAAKYRSEFQLARIQRIAVDSPNGAQSMYDRLKDQISGEDHIKVEKLLEPIKARQDGTAVAAEITGTPGPATQRLTQAAVTGAPVRVAGANLPALVTAAAAGETQLGADTRTSPAGASGVMQVMPGTARDISRQRGDGLITDAMSDADVQAALKNPKVGLVYGATYMTQMLKQFGGDVQAALVAYNAGPANADKWLKAGRDWTALPKPQETRPYVEKAMSRYADLDGGGATDGGGRPNVYTTVASGGLPPVGQRMTADKWTLKFYKPGDLLAPTEGGQAINARAATMADMLGQRFFDATGIRVGVNDADTGSGGTAGRRRGVADPGDNPHVENSQHVHGKAFDFQIQSLTPDQKAAFLQTAREIGFTGVGFYKEGNGHLHLDIGRSRSWGSMPDWAVAAMGTRPAALGQSDMAVPETIGGLPVPANMRAGAGGRATSAPRVVIGAPTVGTGSSFLPASLTADGQAIIGAPAPASVSATAAAAQPVVGGTIPGVSRSIRLPDDFDAQAWRDAVRDDPRLDTPAKQTAARTAVEREIRSRESARKTALRDLRANAIRHVQGGGSSDNLDPDTYSALLELDPKFVIDTLPGMEDRIVKRSDKTDERTYNHLNEMDKDTFKQVDLDEFVDRLSKADRRTLGQRQQTLQKDDATAAQTWNGIQTRKEMAKSALSSIGVFTDKDEAAPNARVGLFMMRMQQDVDAFTDQQKRPPNAKETQDIITNLTTPINASGVLSNKPNKYLFEAGTETENTRRRTMFDGMAPVGDVGALAAANKLEEVPAPVLQNIVDNSVRLTGAAPKSADAIQLYNDGLSVTTGRLVDPPNDRRREIIAGLRAMYGPDETRWPRGKDDLVKDVYARTLRKLFAPVPQQSGMDYKAFSGEPSAAPVIPY